LATAAKAFWIYPQDGRLWAGHLQHYSPCSRPITIPFLSQMEKMPLLFMGPLGISTLYRVCCLDRSSAGNRVGAKV